MEYILQINANGAVIRIGIHDICHEVPPLTVDGCIGTLSPQFGIINLDIAKQSQGFLIQKDGVVLTAVLMDHILHLRPQQVMAALILLLMLRRYFFIRYWLKPQAFK